MDPRRSAQDVVRCDLCKENIVQSYCDVCHVNLCNPCIGDHISDGYHKHVIVPFQERKSTLKFPLCKIHSKETCKLQCKSCNMFLCVICSVSHEHKESDFIVLEDICKTKKGGIVMDTEEIERLIAPTYEEIRKDLIDQIARLDGEYEKIATVMSEQGEKWHTEVDRVINKMKNEITEIKENHRSILEKHLNEIKQIESLIVVNLSALKELEESNDVSVIIEYIPRIKEFRKLLAKVHVTLPSFSPTPINGEQIYEIFGPIKPIVSTTDEYGYKIKSQENSPRELLDVPKVINTFNTGYKDLRGISFNSKGEIWTTSALTANIKCFSTVGKCMKTITTRSEQWPTDIVAINGADLVFSDWKLNTLNKMKDEKIEEIVRLKGWIPMNLCITSFGELLVVVCACNVDNILCKVVRYSGSSEKQTIQFDEEGKPLYSENYNLKYISENRNHDICVADSGVSAVVVVDQSGKLRWRYTGHSSGVNKNLFKPYGITTNSQRHILTADHYNNCIHILNQDGQFLRYIEDVKNPHGLCVDKLDNLFVAEYNTGDVKIIKYLK